MSKKAQEILKNKNSSIEKDVDDLKLIDSNEKSNNSTDISGGHLRVIFPTTSEKSSKDIAIKEKDKCHNNRYIPENRITPHVIEDRNSEKIIEEKQDLPLTVFDGNTAKKQDEFFDVNKKQDIKNKKDKRKIRDKSQKTVSYYYRAKNHFDLYKMGFSFQENFKEKIKSFAFNSLDLKEDQEKTIIGLVSYFAYHEDIKITVVTEDFENSFYSKFMTNVLNSAKSFPLENIPYKVFSEGKIDFIEFNELLKIEDKMKEHTIENVVGSLVEESDIIFWDLPSTVEMDKKRELFFPINRKIERVSFILEENKSKFKEIEKVIDYYKKYNIKIKGSILRPKRVIVDE